MSLLFTKLKTTEEMGANIKLCVQKNPGVFRLTLKDGLPSKSQILIVVDDLENESSALRDIIRAHLLSESFKPVGSTASLRLEVGGSDAPVEAQELSIAEIPENSLDCAACRVTTSDLQSLRIHYREHIADGTLSCSFCEVPFRTLASFKEHLQLHGRADKKQPTKYMAQCNHCNMKFSTVKGLASHRRIHFFEQKLLTAVSQQQNTNEVHVRGLKTEGPTTVRQLLQRQQPAEQHKTDTIICAYCGEHFSSKTKLDAHLLKRHPGVLSDRCPQCDKAFLTAADLRNHILQRHSVHFLYTTENESILLDQSEFNCNYCSSKYQEPVDLLVHCKTDHLEKLTSFECPHCEQKFSMEKRYLNHLRSKGTICGKRPVCGVCSKPFSSTKSLRDHMRAVHPEGESFTRMLRCPICSEGYATKSALRYHVKAKHGIERHPCSMCDKTFALTVQKIRHERRVHQKANKQFPCNLCERSFFTSRELLQHLLNGHKTVPSVNEYGRAIFSDGSVGPTMKYYACEYCPLTTYSRRCFIRHQVDHTGIWPFTCEVCGKGFSERFQALKHVRHQHALNTSTTFTCTHCLRVFLNNENFKTHLEFHRNSAGQTCDVCNKYYESPQSLENHKSITHHISAGQRFRCDYCDRHFENRTFLKKHYSTKHLQLKSLRCSICLRSFKRQDVLRRHKYTKCRLQKPSRFCPICQMTIRNSSLFIIHRRLHQRIKPFSCSICSESFMFAVSLREHMECHHQINKHKKTPPAAFLGGNLASPACTESHTPLRESDVLIESASDLLDLAEIADVIEVD